MRSTSLLGALLLVALQFCSLGNAQVVGPYPSSTTLPALGTFFATGDFNKDGKMDFVASSNYDRIAVFLGNGDGSFPLPVYYPVTAPMGLEVADLNGDGNLDIVVANYNLTPSGGSVSVLLGNGDGTFQPAVTYATGANTNPVAIAVGDLNGDGNPDLVVSDNNGSMLVFLNKGNGTFGNPTSYPVVNPFWVALADVNHDGHLDVIAANSCSQLQHDTNGVIFNCNNGSGSPGTVSVLLGNGDGSFQPAVTYSFDDAPMFPTVPSGQLVVADFNGDGFADIAIAGVAVLVNHGDGTFSPPFLHSPGLSSFGLAAVDVNGDGKMDLVTGGSGINTPLGLDTLIGDGLGNFQIEYNDVSGGGRLHGSRGFQRGRQT